MSREAAGLCRLAMESDGADENLAVPVQAQDAGESDPPHEEREDDDDLLVAQAQRVNCLGWQVEMCVLQQIIGASFIGICILIVLIVLISQLFR